MFFAYKSLTTFKAGNLHASVARQTYRQNLFCSKPNKTTT